MSFSTITDKELHLLSTTKQSGLATQLYIALRSFAWNSNKVFPSIKKISELLGNAYRRTSIHKALKSLEKAGLIEINERTSKSRFVLLARKVATAAKQAVKECFQSDTSDVSNRTQETKKKKENYKKYNKKRTFQNHKRRNNRFQAPSKEQQQSPPRIQPPTDEIRQNLSKIIQVSLGLMGQGASKYQHYSCRGIKKSSLIGVRNHFQKILDTPIKMRNENEFDNNQCIQFIKTTNEWLIWMEEQIKC